MINVALCSLLLVGCAAQPDEFTPSVNLVADPVPVPYGWGEIGFSFGDSGFGECGLGWYKFDETDCQITIGVVFVPMLRERTGTNAQTHRDQRFVEVDSRLTGYALKIAVAHEVGHVLLDTSEHTRTGIMSGSSLAISDDDRELACRSIGRGC